MTRAEAITRIRETAIEHGLGMDADGEELVVIDTGPRDLFRVALVFVCGDADFGRFALHVCASIRAHAEGFAQ